MSRFAALILTPWEKLYSVVAREQRVTGGAGVGAFSVHAYHGDPVSLSGGLTIESGDPVLELHLINYRLHDVVKKKDDSLASNELAILRREYAALAAMAVRGETGDFKAVYGLTLLSPMVRRLGFEVTPAPDTRAFRTIARWQDILRRAYYPTGHTGKNRRSLVVYWMAKDELIKKYGAL